MLFFTEHNLQPDGSSKSLLILAGILIGLSIYFIIISLFDLFMKTVFNCEQLGAFDAVFLLDGEKNYSNIVISLVFEKFEF